MKFRIGHPAYTGRNAMKWHDSYRAAFSDILRRGVSMADAHKALRLALGTIGAVATTEISFNGTKMFACEVMVRD